MTWASEPTRLKSSVMFLDSWSCYVRHQCLGLITFLCFNLSRKVIVKKKPIHGSAADFTKRSELKLSALLMWGCWAGLYTLVCVALTSSLCSDPGFWKYHWIWACWDLGMHSRKVELFWTPKIIRSSTSPPPRPAGNRNIFCEVFINKEWFISETVNKQWPEINSEQFEVYILSSVPQHWTAGSPFLMSCLLARLENKQRIFLLCLIFYLKY